MSSKNTSQHKRCTKKESNFGWYCELEEGHVGFHQYTRTFSEEHSID